MNKRTVRTVKLTQVEAQAVFAALCQHVPYSTGKTAENRVLSKLRKFLKSSV